MRIETRYDVGHHVFFLSDNKVVSGEVSVIRTSSGKWDKRVGLESFIKYVIITEHKTHELDEVDVFPTKEELLESL